MTIVLPPTLGLLYDSAPITKRASWRSFEDLIAGKMFAAFAELRRKLYAVPKGPKGEKRPSDAIGAASVDHACSFRRGISGADVRCDLAARILAGRRLVALCHFSGMIP